MQILDLRRGASSKVTESVGVPEVVELYVPQKTTGNRVKIQWRTGRRSRRVLFLDNIRVHAVSRQWAPLGLLLLPRYLVQRWQADVRRRSSGWWGRRTPVGSQNRWVCRPSIRRRRNIAAIVIRQGREAPCRPGDYRAGRPSNSSLACSIAPFVRKQNSTSLTRPFVLAGTAGQSSNALSVGLS